MEQTNTTSKSSKVFNLTNKLLNKILLMLVIVLLIFIIINQNNTSTKTISSKTTKLNFYEISELITIVSYSTEIGELKEHREILNIKIPFSDSSLIYQYDTTIKAGIDFSKITYNINHQDQIIDITLPEAYIISSDLDYDSYHIYHESESLFTNLSSEDINKSKIVLLENAERNAIDNGILKQAIENAKNHILIMIKNIADIKDYQIKYN